MRAEPITVYQKQWAFTNSEGPPLRTSSFGPCYIVTFASGNRYAAMTHIDCYTEVESIQNIFERFRKLSIRPEHVKVEVMGGWADGSFSGHSFTCGQKILAEIRDAGAREVITERMYQKETPLSIPLLSSTEEELRPHYYFGASIDAATGETCLAAERDESMELEQASQRDRFLSLYGENYRYVPLEEVKLNQGNEFLTLFAVAIATLDAAATHYVSRP